jgi:hypothetical protein
MEDKEYTVKARFDPHGIAKPVYMVFRWKNGQRWEHSSYYDEKKAHEVCKNLNTSRG